MELYEAILNRRSHRFYKPETPPREALKRVINAGLWAPSGTNAQPWEIDVLTGRYRDELVERAAHCIAHMIPVLRAANIPEKGQEMVMKFFRDLGGAPVVIAVTIYKLPDPGMMEAYIQSGAALMQNMLLAAHAEGLGACWMTGPNFVAQEILDYLGKPEQHLLAITPIGYSAKEPPVPPRKERPVR
ncbi:MAG: nitroreductase family protein, partial [Deltaproteobacteria bacterium]|nr:nitroreductase family protein [Deltaproteobacteria bacterium]